MRTGGAPSGWTRSRPTRRGRERLIAEHKAQMEELRTLLGAKGAQGAANTELAHPRPLQAHGSPREQNLELAARRRARGGAGGGAQGLRRQVEALRCSTIAPRGGDGSAVGGEGHRDGAAVERAQRQLRDARREGQEAQARVADFAGGRVQGFARECPPRTRPARSPQTAAGGRREKQLALTEQMRDLKKQHEVTLRVPRSLSFC